MDNLSFALCGASTSACFHDIDDTTTSPNKFSGSIGSNIAGCVSDWEVNNFRPIRNPTFPYLSNHIVNDLSSDQYYAYQICWCVILAKVNENIRCLKIDPLYHARWLTLGCRILRYYISQINPPMQLTALAEFCVRVYFPSWFQIKWRCFITDGAQNFHSMIERANKFPNQKIRDKALEILQRNSYFARHENILLEMLSDSDEEVRSWAVNKILKIQENSDKEAVHNDTTI